MSLHWLNIAVLVLRKMKGICVWEKSLIYVLSFSSLPTALGCSPVNRVLLFCISSKLLLTCLNHRCNLTFQSPVAKFMSSFLMFVLGEANVLGGGGICVHVCPATSPPACRIKTYKTGVCVVYMLGNPMQVGCHLITCHVQICALSLSHVQSSAWLEGLTAFMVHHPLHMLVLLYINVWKGLWFLTVIGACLHWFQLAFN